MGTPTGMPASTSSSRDRLRAMSPSKMPYGRPVAGLIPIGPNASACRRPSRWPSSWATTVVVSPTKLPTRRRRLALAAQEGVDVDTGPRRRVGVPPVQLLSLAADQGLVLRRSPALTPIVVNRPMAGAVCVNVTLNGGGVDALQVRLDEVPLLDRVDVLALAGGRVEVEVDDLREPALDRVLRRLRRRPASRPPPPSRMFRSALPLIVSS